MGNTGRKEVLDSSEGQLRVSHRSGRNGEQE